MIEKIEAMSEHQVDELEAVLAEQDPDVVKWLLKREPPPPDMLSNGVLMELIKWAQNDPLSKRRQ